MLIGWNHDIMDTTVTGSRGFHILVPFIFSGTDSLSLTNNQSDFSLPQAQSAKKL